MLRCGIRDFSPACRHFWGGNEAMGHWVGIITTSEVTVERGDDGVFVALLGVLVRSCSQCPKTSIL